MLPEKSGQWGVETSKVANRSQHFAGRVACAHVQGLGPKAHAPV